MRAREFILTEGSNLSVSTLNDYPDRPGQFADLINKGFEFTGTSGEKVVFDPVNADQLINRIKNRAEKSIILSATVNGQPNQQFNTSKIIKPPAMRGTGGADAPKARKEYNVGDIGECMMGMAVAGRILNLGDDIGVDQIKKFWPFITWQIGQEGAVKSVTGSISRNVQYPEKGTAQDKLELKLVMNARSYQPLDAMFKSGNIAPDVAATIQSTVNYVNERNEIKNLVNTIRENKNSNTVRVISDGISDNVGTVADLIISIDEKPIRLISLKTGSTRTLGQASGISYENLNFFFKTALNVDISEFREELDSLQGIKDIKAKYRTGLDVLNRVYDEKIFPSLQAELEDGTVRKESEMIKTLARAANIFGRGRNQEDVIIVKLSDNPRSVGYKAMKITDNLYEALKALDLTVSKTNDANGRTIKIKVRKDPDVKIKGDADLLVQIRSFYQSKGYIRNYFEYGDQLIDLAQF